MAAEDTKIIPLAEGSDHPELPFRQAKNEDSEMMDWDPMEPQQSPHDPKSQRRNFTEEDYKSLERRFNDEKKTRLLADAALDVRQRDLEAQEAISKDLEQKLAAVEKRLETAHDHIFRLQPRRSDITEVEAADMFRDVVANTKRWVQNWLEPAIDALDDGRLRERQPSRDPRGISGLMRQHARTWMRAKDTDEEHVVAIIMEFLKNAIFDKSFYCPLDEGTEERTLEVVDHIAAAMAELRRDVSHCRNWRCEALVAITSQPAFAQRRERHIDTLVEDLAAVLSPLLLQEESPSKKLRTEIVEPATRFAHSIQLATAVYTVEWPLPNSSGAVDLAQCERELIPGGSIVGGSPAKHLFDVTPGLYVTDASGEGRPQRALCKPVVLVYGAREGVESSETVLSWLSSAAPRSPISQDKDGGDPTKE